MRGSVAKRLRAHVYGPDGSSRARSYTFNGLMQRVQSGAIVPTQKSSLVADDARRAYQTLKRAWRSATARNRRASAAKRLAE